MSDETRRETPSGHDTDATRRESPHAPTGPTNPTHEANTTLPGVLAHHYQVAVAHPARGSEADLYTITTNDGTHLIAKIYRLGIHPNTQVLNRISHCDPAHVIKLIDHGTTAGRSYEILELAAFGTLTELIATEATEHSPWTTRKNLAQSVLTELSTAIAHVHEQGVFHRDIKPSNVLVRSRQPLDLVLTDFGIAHERDLELSEIMTSAHRTVQYAPPESLGGLVRATSDYWSLGVILVEILAGKHPFHGLKEAEINYALTRESPITLGNEIPDTRLRMLCQGLLVKDEKRRWGATEIERWLAGDTTLKAPEIAPTTAQDEFPPFHLDGNPYTTRRGLARGLAKHWDAGIKQLNRGNISQHLRKHTDDNTVWDAADEALEASKQTADSDAALLSLITDLDPTYAPPYLGTYEINLTNTGLPHLINRVHTNDERANRAIRSLQSSRALRRYAKLTTTPELEAADTRWRETLKAYKDLMNTARRESRVVRAAGSGKPLGEVYAGLFKQFGLVDAKTKGATSDALLADALQLAISPAHAERLGAELHAMAKREPPEQWLEPIMAAFPDHGALLAARDLMGIAVAEYRTRKEDEARVEAAAEAARLATIAEKRREDERQLREVEAMLEERRLLRQRFVLVGTGTGVFVGVIGALYGLAGYIVLTAGGAIWAATWEMRTPAAFERWFLFFALVGCLAFGFAVPESLRSPASDLFPLDVDQTYMRPLRFFAAVVFGLLYGWICAIAVPRTVRLA